jgi:hypothetical protein
MKTLLQPRECKRLPIPSPKYPVERERAIRQRIRHLRKGYKAAIDLALDFLGSIELEEQRLEKDQL